ncbi:MAG: single-stranded DNA-binding protein [Dehalococcoidia bacterium]
MLNKATVIGNLGRDPEMRYTPNGNPVTEFSVATSRQFNSRDGERVEETEWFNIVTWNRLAETCAQYLTKGRQVYVEGRMRTRSWDGECGKKHYRTELVAETVKFLGGRDAGEQSSYDPGIAVGADAEGDVEPDDLPF